MKSRGACALHKKRGRLKQPRGDLTTDGRSEGVRRAVLLILLLVLAALLRFDALSWGLRHRPDWDERVFVENVALMLRVRDLDHRYYEYPGLVFYLLAPAVAASGGEGPAAYLAARAVVAGFGVLGVALVFVLGCRLVGETAAAVAALLAAVSPIAVNVAHMVRPDVILEVFVLLALLVFLRLDGSPRRDVVAGIALGAATAVKFTSALLVPSFLLARMLVPADAGARSLPSVLRGVALAGAAALGMFLLLTPYAVLHAAAFATGVGVQVGYHYESERMAGVPYAEMVRAYLGVIHRGLGPAAWLLLGGPWLLWRDARRWAALLAFPLTAVLVFATSDFKRDRFLVPTFGVLALAASAVLESMAAALAARVRRPRIAVAAMALGGLLLAALPLRDSVTWVRNLGEPGSRDRALDWVNAHVSPGSLIVSEIADVGFDRSRHEVLALPGDPGLDRRLVAHAGWLVATPATGQAIGGLRETFRAEGRPEDGSPPLAVYTVPEVARPRLRAVPLTAGQVRASENGEGVAAMLDEDPSTVWTTAGKQTPGQWIEVDLGSLVDVRRVDLALGTHPRQRGALLRVFVDDGTGWRRVRVVPGRPPFEEQTLDERGVSQVLLVDPVRARALRVTQDGTDTHRWAVARLTVFAAEEGG